MRLIGGNISGAPIKSIGDGSAFSAGGGDPEDRFYSQFNTIWNLQADGEDVLGHPYTLEGNAVFATASPPPNFSGYVRCPSNGAGGDFITCRIPADDPAGLERYQMTNTGEIEFWYRHTGYTSGQTQAIFSVRNYTGNPPPAYGNSFGYSLHQYGPGNRPYIYNQASATIYGGYVSGSAMSADTWHHIRMAFQGSGCYLFVNNSNTGHISNSGKSAPVNGSIITATNNWYVSLGKESQGLGQVAYETWFAGLRITKGRSRYDGGNGITYTADAYAAAQLPHTLDSTGYITSN